MTSQLHVFPNFLHYKKQGVIFHTNLVDRQHLIDHFVYWKIKSETTMKFFYYIMVMHYQSMVAFTSYLIVGIENNTGDIRRFSDPKIDEYPWY